MIIFMSVSTSCSHGAEGIFVEPDASNGSSSNNMCDTIIFNINKLLTLGSHTYSQNTQSMTVWNEIGFIFYTTGYCKIIDLNTKKELKEAKLASQAKDNHVNNAAFSTYYYKSTDKYPILYISPYYKDKQVCYIERFVENENRFELIQTITIETSSYNNQFGDFVVDTDKSLLYVLSFSGSGDIWQIKIFHLPRIEEEQITLTDYDLLALKCVNLDFPNTLQGATYYNGSIYMVFGLHNTRKQLYKVNTNDFSYSSFDFIDFFNNIEPEGLAVYNDVCYMCTNFPKALWTFFKIEPSER